MSCQRENGEDVFVEKNEWDFLSVSGIFETDIVIEEWHLFVLLANGLGSEKNTLRGDKELLDDVMLILSTSTLRVS